MKEAQENRKKLRREIINNMDNTNIEKQNESEEESRWEDPEIEKQRWEKMLEEREIRIETEEKERTAKKAKAERLERSWDLLNLCREVDKDGLSWKKSKERRETERDRKERKTGKSFKKI